MDRQIGHMDRPSCNRAYIIIIIDWEGFKTTLWLQSGKLNSFISSLHLLAIIPFNLKQKDDL